MTAPSYRLGTELSAVQFPFLRYAQEAGWTLLFCVEALFQSLLHHLMTGKAQPTQTPP